MLRSLVVHDQHLGETCCPHIQDRKKFR